MSLKAFGFKFFFNSILSLSIAFLAGIKFIGFEDCGVKLLSPQDLPIVELVDRILRVRLRFSSDNCSVLENKKSL